MKSPKTPNLLKNSTTSVFPAVALDALQRDLEQIHAVIARRAYELFEGRGYEHGHDLEDWLKAQAELVGSIEFETSERRGSLSLRGKVIGFKENEIKTAIEPRRVVVIGMKQASADGPAEQKNPESDPSLLLCVIDLPKDIDPKQAVVEFKSDADGGVLSFDLPKAEGPGVSKQAA